MIIPPEIINLSPADSFRYYRDELKCQVHPVYPPNARCKDPGKQPAYKQWWETDPQDCDLGKYFAPGRSYNIGIAPKNGLVLIDLDSKPDQGKSVQKFLEEHSELDRIPRHATRGGGHVISFCPDLPQWTNPKNGGPFHKTLVSKINDKVSAELYHCERNNIVLPPRFIRAGFAYVWTVFGPIPEVEWNWIRDLFKFEEPAAHCTKASRENPSLAHQIQR